MVVPELRKLMAKLKFRSLYFRQATVFWTMTRCQSIPFSLIAFLMYLKYKCIVPARFARRIYFLGTYNLGAHSLCISSSVFFPKEQTICWLQTCPIIPVALHLSSLCGSATCRPFLLVGFFFPLDVILVRIFSMIQDYLFTRCISRQLW